MRLVLICLAFLLVIASGRKCLNLKPYQPIINTVIAGLPGREIQDLMPLPLVVADGEEIWDWSKFIIICKLQIGLEDVVVQAVNINWEKISVDIIDNEALTFTLPVAVSASARFTSKCGLYHPKIQTSIEFGYTFTGRADLCVDVKALTDPTNILNYTYATVSELKHSSDVEAIHWCITEALPLLKSIIDSVLEENVPKIWEAVNTALETKILPGVEVAINSVLRAAGIPPYNETLPEKIIEMEPIYKKTKIFDEKMAKLEVITTSNFSSFVWNDEKSGAWMDGSFYRPIVPDANLTDFYPLGHYGQRNFNAPLGSVQLVKYDGGALTAFPIGFEQIWTDKGSRAKFQGSFWRPIAPEGYTALGHVVQSGYNEPNIQSVLTIQNDCVVRCDPWLVWSDRCSGAKEDVSVWEIVETTSPPTGVFVTSNGYNRPDDSLLWCLDPSCVKR